MSFGVLEMSFTLLEMSFGILEMRFADKGMNYVLLEAKCVQILLKFGTISFQGSHRPFSDVF